MQAAVGSNPVICWGGKRRLAFGSICSACLENAVVLDSASCAARERASDPVAGNLLTTDAVAEVLGSAVVFRRTAIGMNSRGASAVVSTDANPCQTRTQVWVCVCVNN